MLKTLALIVITVATLTACGGPKHTGPSDLTPLEISTRAECMTLVQERWATGSVVERTDYTRNQPSSATSPLKSPGFLILVSGHNGAHTRVGGICSGHNIIAMVGTDTDTTANIWKRTAFGWSQSRTDITQQAADSPT